MYIIHNIKKIILSIILIVTFSCNDKIKNDSRIKTNDSISKVIINDSSLKKSLNVLKVKPLNWVFDEVLSLSKSYNCEKTHKFLNFKIYIENDSVYIDNIYADVVYSGELKSESFFKKSGMSKDFFLTKYNIKIPEKVKYIRNKKVYDINSKLDAFFDEAFFAENYLFFENNGCVYRYKKNNLNNVYKSINKNEIDCKTKQSEMEYEESCMFKNTTIKIVYEEIIKNGIVENNNTLLINLPNQSQEQKINIQGLISNNYIIKQNSALIEMLYVGGVTSISLEQIENDVKRTIINSAD